MRRSTVRVGVISAVAVLTVVGASYGVVRKLYHQESATLSAEWGVADHLTDIIFAGIIGKDGWIRPQMALLPTAQTEHRSFDGLTLSSGRAELPMAAGFAASGAPPRTNLDEASAGSASPCSSPLCFTSPAAWYVAASRSTESGSIAVPEAPALALRNPMLASELTEAAFSHPALVGNDAVREALTAAPAFSEPGQAEEPARIDVAEERAREERRSIAAARGAEPAPVEQAAEATAAPGNEESALLLETIERPVTLNGDWIVGPSLATEVFELAAEGKPIEQPVTVLGVPTLKVESFSALVAEVPADVRRIQEELSLVADVGTTTTPEPATLLLLATGLIALTVVDLVRRWKTRS